MMETIAAFFAMMVSKYPKYDFVSCVLGAPGEETPYYQIHSFLTTILVVFHLLDIVVNEELGGYIPSELFRLSSLSNLYLCK
jgi:hypothetical protein